MEREQLKPGEVAAIYEVQQRIFFYERPDGTIFDVNEKNAWKVHRKFKQFGVSDGSHYAEALKKIRIIAKTASPDEVNAELKRALDAEIEAARGNYAVPRDSSVETFGNKKLENFLRKMNA